MLANREDNTFGKKEHLCKHTLIDELFGGKAMVQTTWPFRMVYLLVDKDNLREYVPVQVMVSVSKRFFKRAVKRNRVKRQLREAYRHHKHLLVERMASMPDKQLLLAIVWQEANLCDSAKVDAKMEKGLQRLVEKL